MHVLSDPMRAGYHDWNNVAVVWDFWNSYTEIVGCIIESLLYVKQSWKMHIHVELSDEKQAAKHWQVTQDNRQKHIDFLSLWLLRGSKFSGKRRCPSTSETGKSFGFSIADVILHVARGARQSVVCQVVNKGTHSTGFSHSSSRHSIDFHAAFMVPFSFIRQYRTMSVGKGCIVTDHSSKNG